MRFGMPTLLEIKPPESCAVLCRELGLDFVELSMDMPEYQADRLDVEKLRQIAASFGVCYTIHLNGFLNPCDFNDKIAAAYNETVLEVINIAKKLAVPVLNMHLPLGDKFTLPIKAYTFSTNISRNIFANSPFSAMSAKRRQVTLISKSARKTRARSSSVSARTGLPYCSKATFLP